MRSATLPLLAAAVLPILAGGCQDNPYVDSLLDPDIRQFAETSGMDLGLTNSDPFVFAENLLSSLAFADGRNWDGWTLAAPEQTWTTADGKFISFTPESNRAVSPEFEPATELRVSFEIFLPARFPVFGFPLGAVTCRAIGLTSYNPAVGERPAEFTELAIDLFRGSQWQAYASSGDGYHPDWTSGIEFPLPWIFDHGWNRVEWTLLLREGARNDAMRIEVGDRIFAWSDINLALSDRGIRHVTIGPWGASRGDQFFAIRNLRVDSSSADPPPPPPTEPPPPPDDPPPPPDDPLPPPPSEGDIAVGGYVYQEGFWRGWRGDSRRNYTEVNGHGAMGTNASAVRYIGADEDGAGRYGFRVRFNHANQLNLFGGRHLAGVASNSLAFRPYDDDGRRYPWDTTRIDLDRPSDGRIRGHLYSWIGDELYEEVYWFRVPFALGEWGNVDLQWRQTGDRLVITVNGDSHTFNLLPGAPMLGSYLYLGNMDNITGVIEFDDFYFSQ